MLIRNFLKSLKLFWLFKRIAIIFLHLNSRIFISINSKNIKALNLGSGPVKSQNKLLNVDLFGADINFDLTKKFPFKDNSIEFIYTSHFLEHMTFKELTYLLSECYRVLKPGSKISVVVPNARLYIDAYLNNDTFLSYDEMFEGGKVETGSPIDQINYIAYLGGDHKHMFDMESLLKILNSHGFTNSRERDFDSDYDKENRDYESIYAEAYK